MNRINVVAAFVCLCAVAVARAQNMAIVDMEELVRLHPDTASDKKLFDQTLKDFRAENDELRQKLEGIQEDFEKIRKEAQDPALSDKARKTAEERAAKARDALIAADRTAREKVQSRQEQLSDMQNRMLKKTVSEIREVIGKYAQEHKLHVVLSGSQVVFSDKSLDITSAILKQMNIAQPPKEAEVAPVIREKREDSAATARPPVSTPPVATPAVVPRPAVSTNAPAAPTNAPAAPTNAPAMPK